MIPVHFVDTYLSSCLAFIDVYSKCLPRRVALSAFRLAFRASGEVNFRISTFELFGRTTYKTKEAQIFAIDFQKGIS